MTGHIKFPTELEVDTILYGRRSSSQQCKTYGPMVAVTPIVYAIALAILMILYSTHILSPRGAMIGGYFTGSVAGATGLGMLIPLFYFCRYRISPMNMDSLTKKLKSEVKYGNRYFNIKPTTDNINQLIPRLPADS